MKNVKFHSPQKYSPATIKDHTVWDYQLLSLLGTCWTVYSFTVSLNWLPSLLLTVLCCCLLCAPLCHFLYVVTSGRVEHRLACSQRSKVAIECEATCTGVDAAWHIHCEHTPMHHIHTYAQMRTRMYAYTQTHTYMHSYARTHVVCCCLLVSTFVTCSTHVRGLFSESGLVQHGEALHIRGLD